MKPAAARLAQPPGALSRQRASMQAARVGGLEQPRRAQVLATLSRWVDEVPPSTQSLRYGNPAYRVWAARAAAAAEGFMERVLGPGLAPLAPELAPYLPGALGNAQRIDYGTGHETAFAALLFCLARAGAVRRRRSRRAAGGARCLAHPRVHAGERCPGRPGVCGLLPGTCCVVEARLIRRRAAVAGRWARRTGRRW